MLTFPEGSGVKNPPAMQETGETQVRSLGPGLRISPGGKNGNQLHYSCLENTMDRGDWLAAVHRVTQSLNTSTNTHSSNKSLYLYQYMHKYIKIYTDK